jgi:hypothetical protein
VLSTLRALGGTITRERTLEQAWTAADAGVEAAAPHCLREFIESEHQKFTMCPYEQ